MRLPEQRGFIMDEIVTSVSKVPYKEKDWRLSSGKKISLFTALILSMWKNLFVDYTLPEDETVESGQVRVFTLSVPI